MKLNDLQKVIDYALQQAKDGCGVLDDTTGHGYDSADYYEQQLSDLKAIKEELDAVRKLYDEDDESKTWSDEIHIITTSNMCDMINMGLYDFYGECYRKNNNQALTSEEFIAVLKDSINIWGYEHFTDEMIDGGWQVIQDLYEDNEREEANDPLTGHFIK